MKLKQLKLKPLFNKRNILFFLLITIIPSFMISYSITEQRMEKVEAQNIDNAQKYATLHANHIDAFISETSGRLEMLATVLQFQQKDLKTIEEIIVKTQKTDERFSGFYWASLNGDLLVGSNGTLPPTNVLDRDYFQQALAKKQTIISEPHIGRVTGRYIITIATPVTNQNDRIEGVLLSSIRLDKLEEVIEEYVTNEVVEVTDHNGQTLLQSGVAPLENNHYNIQVKTERVPWTITVTILSTDDPLYFNIFIQSFIILFIITTIIYLLIYYYRLQEKLKIENEQNELQKLQLVENLAASTAHEIRNPLTGIKGLIQLLNEKHTDDKDQFYFNVIQEEVNRINGIVTELLILGKPTAYTLNTYDANDIIKEITPLIQSEAHFKNVQLTLNHSDNALPISCVKDHVKQVILNLVKNSIEAMESPDNRLTISLENDHKYCIITVKDNGIGMSQKTLSQIFHPFFTTKTYGTGLGMAVCQRIIQMYGGKITVHSELQKGTEVIIAIPLQKEQ
ncbi:ATP-binding protein [Anaerobacillus sp. MEB173]|uniref:ATP-binding protein n=1 Tax=Anaerobacillus sp. MEB173 TaxID=3383345 RepID=UPI003F9330D5